MEVDPASRSQQANSRLKAGQADNLASPSRIRYLSRTRDPVMGIDNLASPQIRYPSQARDSAMGIDTLASPRFDTRRGRRAPQWVSNPGGVRAATRGSPHSARPSPHSARPSPTQPLTQSRVVSRATTSTRSDCAAMTASRSLYAAGISSTTPASFRHSTPAV